MCCIIEKNKKDFPKEAVQSLDDLEGVAGGTIYHHTNGPKRDLWIVNDNDGTPKEFKTQEEAMKFAEELGIPTDIMHCATIKYLPMGIKEVKKEEK